MPALNGPVARPLSVTITDVRLTNYAGDYTVSIFAQMIAVSVFSSMFQPLQKMEIDIYDAIGLFVNFPLVGEETVEIEYTTPGIDTRQYLKMVVVEPKNITPDPKGRSMTYTLVCFSPEIITNSTMRLQKCLPTTFAESAESILKNDLKTEKQVTVSPSRGTQSFVVPNMYPLEAVTLLSHLAVPENTREYLYVFFENARGFHFVTVESLISVKPKAKYYYLPANVQVDDPEVDYYRIVSLTENKRFNTLEKQSQGFYANEYYEIDYFNKKVISTKVNSEESEPHHPTISDGQLNTPKFIKEMKGTNADAGKGVAPRVRYRTLNGARNTEQMGLGEKFGAATIHKTAMSQISLTITIPGDSRLSAGDMIEVDIPEFHGFTEINKDDYIAGKYLIVDCKHLLAVGEKHTTTLNLSRDSYSIPIGPNRYGPLNGSKPMGQGGIGRA